MMPTPRNWHLKPSFWFVLITIAALFGWSTLQQITFVPRVPLRGYIEAFTCASARSSPLRFVAAEGHRPVPETSPLVILWIGSRRSKVLRLSPLRKHHAEEVVQQFAAVSLPFNFWRNSDCCSQYRHRCQKSEDRCRPNIR